MALGLGLTLFVTLAGHTDEHRQRNQKQHPQTGAQLFHSRYPDGTDLFTEMVKRHRCQGDREHDTRAARYHRAGGQRVERLKELPEGAWVLNGDRGLTYSAILPKGSKWSPAMVARDYKGPPLISLEANAILGLKVGDSMTVSLLGVEVPGKDRFLATVNGTISG